MSITNAITELNDQFRRGDIPFLECLLTPGVCALPSSKRTELIGLVQTFDQFTLDKDPDGKHDFGEVNLDGEDYFFKIECYDPTMSRHADDPSSPNATRRVLILMRADEF